MMYFSWAGGYRSDEYEGTLVHIICIVMKEIESCPLENGFRANLQTLIPTILELKIVAARNTLSL